LIDFNLFDL